MSLVSVASAQLKINDDGHVGIGVNPYNSRILNVECDGCASFGYGIYSVSRNVSGAYGIYALAEANGYNGYGIMAIANSGSASNNYAVYGNASGAVNNNWAGWFIGDVRVTGSITEGSDERFKKNIQSLDEDDMLNRILQVQPRRYQYRTEEELEQAGMPVFGTKEGEHLGLIAQELEVIFPELVNDAESLINPEMTGESREEKTVTTKGVHYSGLIPVLIAGIQEQQTQIEELEARIAALEALMQE